MASSPGTILKVHIWVVATLIPLLVKLLPLKTLLRVLRPAGRFRPYGGVRPEVIAQMVRRRLANPRNMRRRACLREGLTLFHFLRLAGEPAVIHIGVHPPGRDTGRIRGHCWVELNGTPVSEPIQEPSATLLVYS